MYYIPGTTPPAPAAPKPHIRLKVRPTITPPISNAPPPPKWMVVWDEVPEKLRAEIASRGTPMFFHREAAEGWLEEVENDHECYGHVVPVHHQ
jgi:hypothetical protein